MQVSIIVSVCVTRCRSNTIVVKADCLVDFKRTKAHKKSDQYVVKFQLIFPVCLLCDCSGCPNNLNDNQKRTDRRGKTEARRRPGDVPRKIENQLNAHRERDLSALVTPTVIRLVPTIVLYYTFNILLCVTLTWWSCKWNVLASTGDFLNGSCRRSNVRKSTNR